MLTNVIENVFDDLGTVFACSAPQEGASFTGIRKKTMKKFKKFKKLKTNGSFFS